MKHAASPVCWPTSLRWIFRRGLLTLPVAFLLLGEALWAQEKAPVSAATLGGTVVDADGEAIVGAEIKLHLPDSKADNTTKTDDDGHFQFSGITEQHVDLSVKAEGFGPFSKSIALQPGEALELEPIKLGAAANLNVEVGALTQEELAEQQIHEEEHQRLLGVLPNFFVSYTWKAAPLTSKQKFELAWKTTIDPVNIGISAATAGVEQAQNHFEEYGRGPTGYAKRFGANYADLVIGIFAGGAVFPALMHQDPRYFYMGTGSVWKRAGYALATSVVCRGDNGRWQACYSAILGDLAAGAATNLYYPANDRTGLSQTFTNSLVGVAFDSVGNLIQEFLLKKITPTSKKQKSSSTTSNP